MNKNNASNLNDNFHLLAVPMKMLQRKLKISDLIGSIIVLGLITILPLGWLAVNPVQAATVPTDTVALENETDMSLYSPPSPDPAGITYLIAADRLLISDSEVDEIAPPNPATYTGKNLFVTSRTGSLDYTLTTYDPPGISISNEPSGVTYNPNNDFLYFSDNNSNKILELDPGDDSLYNTGDDQIRTYNTTAIGSLDPAGITYDGNRGHLLIVDDIGEEVYDIDLGTNGILDQTDAVTNFDVASLGIRNPEGIEFNPVNNHLYILSSRTFDGLIGETTISGLLVRYLNIISIDAVNPAGLAFAPASDGAPQNNLYIVARGVDNGTEPLENDGKMYEVSFPLNAPPAVDAGPDDSVTLPDNYSLDGTVEDDGLPVSPGSVTTNWSAESGPGSVTFGDANQVDTTASFSTAGVYVLRLIANDGARINYDEVTITVNPAGNQPPNVNAGLDQIIAFPDTANLDGTVDDDGLPAPPVLVTIWSKISGPGSVIFANNSAISTTASFSTIGVYTLRLTASDGALSSFDEVTITVNQSPSVSAGSDQTITLPDSASLNGTVDDDGLPAPPALTTEWSKVSGSGSVVFADPSAVDTTASFSTSDVYILRLTADDGALSAFDEVEITVNPDPNQPPSVNAGLDQTITLPDSASLIGTVDDDGLPVPPSLTTDWSKVSGPGTVSFVDASAVATSASFSIEGLYVLRLTANDSAKSAFDDITITVNPDPNQAPDVNAGLDQMITLPDSAVLKGIVTDDGLPNPPSLFTTIWSKVSGLGEVTFSDPSALNTSASFSIDGIYVLRLKANDGAKSAFDDITITVNPDPNQAPVVNAGLDQTITLPGSAELVGSVSDDGLPDPPGSCTTDWIKVDGPGEVTFSNSNALVTTANFSVGGQYILRLTANDGSWTSYDDVMITVNSQLKRVWIPLIIYFKSDS